MPKLITKENAREMQRRGAEARKRNSKNRKTMREAFNILLNMTIKTGEVFNIEEVNDLPYLEKKI